MKKVLNFTLLLILTFNFICCQQRNILGKERAKEVLNSTLYTFSKQHLENVSPIILKKEATAVETAEKILFDIYGKDNIVKQRPYEVYFIDKYWIIMGTLPKGYDGGTFEIVIDARTEKALSIAHGK